MGNSTRRVLQMAIASIMSTGGLFYTSMANNTSSDVDDVQSDEEDNDIIDVDCKEEVVTDVEETPRLTNTSSEGNN